MSDLSLTVGGNVIKQLEKVRDLDVILDQTLSFDDHISTICQSAHFHIRNSRRIRNLLSFDACATLIHALIGSFLDYCNSLLYNIADAKVEKLQKIAESSRAPINKKNDKNRDWKSTNRWSRIKTDYIHFSNC